MLSAVVRLVLALETLLLCGEAGIPGARSFLPLGDSHPAQLGILLGLAVGGVELWKAVSCLFKRYRISPMAEQSEKRTLLTPVEDVIEHNL